VSAEEHAAASPEDRNKAAVKNAYDKILKPILSVAKAKGHLEVVPQLNGKSFIFSLISKA
jgi:hypothetical protein